MIKNKFLYARMETIYTQDGSAALLTIYRKNGRVSSWSIQKNVKRFLNVLNKEGYKKVADEFGQITFTKEHYDPYSKEGHYREVLTNVFDWLESNVDGYLEDVPGADYCWHMLGAIVGGGPKYYWSKLEHREAFLENERMPGAWEPLFKILEIK